MNKIKMLGITIISVFLIACANKDSMQDVNSCLTSVEKLEETRIPYKSLETNYDSEEEVRMLYKALAQCNADKQSLKTEYERFIEEGVQ